MVVEGSGVVVGSSGGNVVAGGSVEVVATGLEFITDTGLPVSWLSLTETKRKSCLEYYVSPLNYSDLALMISSVSKWELKIVLVIQNIKR